MSNFMSDSDALQVFGPYAEEINKGKGVIAVRETSPATAAHSVGEYVRYNGTTYKVKSAISIGDSLILNTNIEANGLPDGTTIFTPETIGDPTVAFLDDLGDVDISDPQDGDLPMYNSTSGKFENARIDVTNPNLLDNPWFTVNQRGFTSGTYSTKTYIVDRWCTNRSTVSLVNGGLSLAKDSGTDGWIRQYLENDYAGETLTISLIVDNVIYSKSGIGTFNFNVSPSVYVKWDESLKMLHIENASTTAVTIRAVKLEKGSSSTLHLDTAPDYTTELLKCQRYFYRIQAGSSYTYIAIGALESATAGDIIIKLPVAMRDTATLSSAGTFSISEKGSAKTASNLSISMRANDWALISFTTSGATAGSACIFTLHSGSYIDFSAEL